jgi:phosphoribosyl 1,2-cyclic phosphate phosphodiesterase
MDVWATEETEASLRREFAYVFENASYPGVPQLRVHRITPGENFSVNGVEIVPIRVLHYKLEVLGFRIGPFSYITDANFIAPEEKDKLRGSEALVLNALRHEHHVSHFTLEEAIAIAREVDAKETYFTHISHQLGRYETVERSLPPHMHLAYDGLTLHFPPSA